MAAFFASLLAHERTVSTILCLLALLGSTALSLSSSSSSSTPFSSLSTSSALVVQQKQPQSSICYPPDRAALQVVATAFSRSSPAAHSFFRLHWRAELDCCFWLGVTCSSRSIFINATTKSSMASNNTSAHANPKVMPTYSRVVGLSLANKRDYWVMSIPPALCRLSALASLDLSDNWLGGSIPSCIGHNLTSLKTLILGGNWYLSGSLASLANLSLLSHLDLSDNSFNTSSMSSFSSTLWPFRFLTSLKTLNLSGNWYLSGSLAPLANLSLLSHLDLSANRFNTSSMSSFSSSNFPHLTHLDLSTNSLSGTLWPFRFLTSLKTLILSQNWGLSGSLAPLANLSLLSHLDLSENNFSTLMSSLSSSNFPHLTHLDLSWNSLSGTLLPFRFLTSLKTLILSYNWYLYGSLSPLANLSLLSHLDLSGNSLNGTLFPLKFNTLGYLDLSYNQFSGSLSPASFSTVPLLQYLDISGNNGLMAQDLGSVLERLLHLEHLHMTMAVSASNLGILLCKARSLQFLEVSVGDGQQEIDAGYGANNHLHDQLPCEKVASAWSLTHLSLRGQGLTGPLPTWFGDFSRLQWLDLSGNNFQGSIPQAWQALTQLTGLAISGDSPSTPVLLSQEVQSWLFRLPLESLVLTSMGLTSQDFPCVAGLSLLNHTLTWLDLSDNHISPGHALWHCLQHHTFSHLKTLSLSNNSLALHLDQQHDLALSQDSNINGWLDLSFCELSGSVSHIVELLPWTSVMLLGHNNLTDSIPSQIGTLGSSLEALDLSHNQLTGTIPSSIWNLTNLEYLNLENNNLHGEVVVVDVAQRQQGLLNLLASGNLFTKASFANVTGGLEILDLGMNKLEGTIEDLLGDQPVLTYLQFLLLDNNQLTGSIPTSLGTSAPSLITIDLSHNKLIGAIPRSLHGLQALHSKLPVTVGWFALSIGLMSGGGEVTVSPAGALTLESVKNVKFPLLGNSRGHLDLSSNQLSGSIPEGLGALLGLNDLNLSRNQLSGPIPPSLAHLLNLESLDLSFNNLQGSIPMAFSNLTSLEVFNVSFNPQLSGQIPAGPQLETATSYEGDYNLCGEPLQKDCHEQQQIVTPYIQKHKSKVGIKRSIWLAIQRIEEWASIPGICIGYVLGVGLTIWALKMLHFYK